MKAFRKTGILLLAFVLLFGTVGITFYQHTCSGKPGKEITVYPEFFSKHADCCCAETGFSANPISHGCKNQFLSESECCRNTSLFLNASFISLPAVTIQSEIIIPVFIIPLALYSTMEIFTACYDESPLDITESPPLSGKQRILLFHQSKSASLSDHLA